MTTSRAVPPLETGELPPIERDPSKPLKRPRFRPDPADAQARRLRPRHLLLRPAAHPGLPRARRRADQVDPTLPRRSASLLQIAAWFTYSLLTRSALGDGRTVDLAAADVPHPDEHEGAVEHRPRRQRRQLGARLPADDAVGRHRSRRRLRAGHRRPRLGGRAQPDLLDRPAGVDPAPRRQPAVRDGRARRARDHGRGRAASSSGCSTARAGPSGSCAGSPASCASTATPPPAPCARSASGSRS